MNSLLKKKILLVDDEPDWRRRATDSLSHAGFDVLVAADASEALHQAENPHLGLIIVDDNLAGESGLMLTRFLHRNRPEVPILLHTSVLYDEVMILNLLHNGAEQCLPKGSMDELILTAGSYMQ